MTLRGGSPTATGLSIFCMWQSMHSRPAPLPFGAFSHWYGVPWLRWHDAQASTRPTRSSNAPLHSLPPTKLP
jgi:hypothetical protein